METPVRVLLVEDSEDDALLILRELKQGGYHPVSERIDSAQSMKELLHQKAWDIIISDFSMPRFSGFDALRLLQETGFDLPFILVTGAISEEEAVKVMRAGAHDCIMKQNLARLVPAVTRELREAKIRYERQLALEALRQSETLYRAIFENTGTATIIFDETMTVMLINREGENLSGYSKGEIEGKKKWTEFIAQEDLERMRKYHALRGKDPDLIPAQYEFHFIDRAGTVKNIFVTVAIISGTKKRVASLLDITERKASEKKLQESERRYRELYEGSRDGYVMVNMKGQIIESNSTFRGMLGYAEEELRQKIYRDVTPDLWNAAEDKIIQNQVLQRGYSEVYEKEYIRKDTTVFPVELRTYLLRDEEGKSRALWAFVRDVTERKRVEKELKDRIQELENFYNMAIGRELRMIELKEEIEHLREKLEHREEASE
ncbi:MAG: PAS domain S-box protein [Thermodesulfovibrionales bacterium]|nr:PAS domain S-box protein [Thermodesulfovibrionales bacterium]